MANKIFLRGGKGVGMSNGRTAVVFSVLLLSASELAETEWELGFERFLAGRDQQTFGLGCVGFDLADLPWGDPVERARRCAFVLRVIDGALDHRGWRRLDYAPGPGVEDSLRELRTLVAGIEQRPDDGRTATDWPFSRSEPVGHADGYRSPAEHIARCAKHGVAEHEFGCLLCIDFAGMGPEPPPAAN